MEREEKYKEVAMELLKDYLVDEQSAIIEYGGDLKESAKRLKKQVMKYLERLDEDENTFNELVKDMWIFTFYKEESEK